MQLKLEQFRCPDSEVGARLRPVILFAHDVVSSVLTPIGQHVDKGQLSSENPGPLLPGYSCGDGVRDLFHE